MTADLQETHAFLWQNGQRMDLGTLGGHYSVAVSINNRGDVVGNSVTADGELHPFLWSKGKMIDLWEAGCAMAQVSDINDRREIVGTGGPELPHALLCKNNRIIDLGTLKGGEGSWANAINNAGDVVGASLVPEGGQRAFVWSRGVMTYLGVLEGGSYSEAYAISNSGEIVGMSDSADYPPTPRAIRWAGGAAQNLGTLGPDADGFEWSEAHGVNDAGAVAGFSSSPDGSGWRAVMWLKQ